MAGRLPSKQDVEGSIPSWRSRSGVAQSVARGAHNAEVAGSSPAPAIPFEGDATYPECIDTPGYVIAVRPLEEGAR